MLRNVLCIVTPVGWILLHNVLTRPLPMSSCCSQLATLTRPNARWTAWRVSRGLQRSGVMGWGYLEVARVPERPSGAVCLRAAVGWTTWRVSRGCGLGLCRLRVVANGRCRGLVLRAEGRSDACESTACMVWGASIPRTLRCRTAGGMRLGGMGRGAWVHLGWALVPSRPSVRTTWRWRWSSAGWGGVSRSGKGCSMWCCMLQGLS